MKISYTSSLVHKLSAFSVVAVGSMIAWPWTSVVDVSTAGTIVSALGLGKLLLEFITPDVPKDGDGG